MLRMLALDSLTATGTLRRSPDMSTTAADSIAMSVPVPIATDAPEHWISEAVGSAGYGNQERAA